MTLNDVAKALNVDLKAALLPVALAIAAEIHNAIAPYPPAGSGNTPRAWRSRANNSWYQRGSGPRWVVKSGAVHGAQTSQTLGRRWTVTRTPMGAVVGNSATYAPRVQSFSHQAPAFARIGWTTDRAAVAKVMGSSIVKSLITDALSRAFAAKASSPKS